MQHLNRFLVCCNRQIFLASTYVSTEGMNCITFCTHASDVLDVYLI